jgi:hypothetical protein
MEVWEVILVVVAVVVIVAAVIAVVVMKRHREIVDLRDRFGPEYDRRVGKADDRRERKDARGELSDRAERRDQLEIRDLSPSARSRYNDTWINVQTRFVDEPNAAVQDADSLIAQVMRERGYPVDQFDEQADMISVDHPQLVENYRSGHAIFERAKQGQASTEQLRQAFVRYRSLFEELLGSSQQASRR